METASRGIRDEERMTMDKQIVLVTGAAKRTGRAIAERFTREGYSIAVHYGSSEQEADAAVAAIEGMGGNAIAIQADLAEAASLSELIARVYAHFGRLDVLVNCASTFLADHLDDFEAASLDHAWQVNCRAPILLTQAFYKEAKARNQEGVVINIVDQKVRDNFQPDNFTYTVSKVGLGYMTKMLAVSAMPVLRVNAIYPGLLSQSGDQTEQDFAYASKHSTPLGYIATPEDIADAVVLLTLPSFNGADVVVDAGQNLVRVERDVIALHRAPKS